MPQPASRPTAIILRDTDTLAQIHPPMAALVLDLMTSMTNLGYPMTVWEGVRTAEQQFMHFQKGRVRGHEGDAGWALTKDGQVWVPIDPVHLTGIVTNCDGTIKRSNHQAKADGKGRAVDCVFLVDGADADTDLDDPSWDESHPWFVYGALGEHLGGAAVRWLGRSPTLGDLPHFEWVRD